MTFFLLLCGLLSAQAPPPIFDPLNDSVLVEKGLQSTTPLQVAISAFRSVNVSDVERGDWLRMALTQSLSLKPEPEARRARRAIFDALVRTRTHVSLTELLPFYDQFPAAVIAVVARGRGSDTEDRLPLLLKAEAGKNTAYWYASAALVDRKQLIHHLVSQARFDYAISILDQDFVPVRVFERPFAGVAGGIPGGILPGITAGSTVAWPEDVVYEIEMAGDVDRVLTCCVGGNTYLKEWPSSIHAFGDQQPAGLFLFNWEDHDREVVRVLLSFAHCRMCSLNSPDFPNIRGGRATIVWHSPERVRHLLEEAVEQYVKECERMTEALRETALTEPEIRPKVRIWIRDWRKVRTDPIPSIGGGVEVNFCAQIQHASTNGRCID